MTRSALTVLLTLMSGTLTCADDGTLFPGSLRPVTDQTLITVHQSDIYTSAWSDAKADPPVVQTVYETPVVPTTELRPYLDLTHPDTQPSTGFSGSSSMQTNELFSRLAIWTVIVLCLCVLTVLILRRWQRRQGLLPTGRGHARILETLALGPGRAVSLVQLGQYQAFVGTDSGGISTIVLAPPAFEDALDNMDSTDQFDRSTGRSADEQAGRTLGFPGTFSS